MRRAAKLAIATGALASVLAIRCATSPSPRAPSQDAPDLTVMTYNVNFGLAGDEDEVAAIERGHADVVFLQETNAAWEALFRQKLAKDYAYAEFRHSSEWPAGGQGVLSKYPIDVRAVSESPIGFFFAWVVVVHAPSGDAQVLSVHLRPAISETGSVVRGYFETPPLRRQEIEHHVESLDPRLPTLVVGDFNEQDDGRAIRFLEGRGMRTALSEFHPDATTWRWPVGPFTARQRFDHVVYDASKWTCLDAEAIDAGNSDHVPVVARLKISRSTRR